MFAFIRNLSERLMGQQLSEGCCQIRVIRVGKHLWFNNSVYHSYRIIIIHIGAFCKYFISSSRNSNDIFWSYSPPLNFSQFHLHPLSQLTKYSLCCANILKYGACPVECHALKENWPLLSQQLSLASLELILYHL